jgi:hypothetical protein
MEDSIPSPLTAFFKSMKYRLLVGAHSKSALNRIAQVKNCCKELGLSADSSVKGRVNRLEKGEIVKASLNGT